MLLVMPLDSRQYLSDIDKDVFAAGRKSRFLMNMLFAGGIPSARSSENGKIGAFDWIT